MRRLIYAGVLSEDMCRWVLNSEYRFWLEVTDNFPWPEFGRWMEDTWPKDRRLFGEDCMGNTRSRLDNNGYTSDRRFLGLLTEKDMESVSEKFAKFIKNKDPFMVQFG